MQCWVNLWIRFGSILTPFWIQFWFIFELILGLILGPFWVPFWIHFGVHFGVLKWRFACINSKNDKPVWVMNGKRVHFVCLVVFCLSVFLSVCVPVCLSVFLSFCLCVSVRVCVCVCVGVCLCVCVCVSVCLSRLRIFAQCQSLRSRATLASSAPSPRWPHVSIRSNFPRNDNEKSQWECFAIAASKLNTFETDFEFVYTLFIQLIHFGNHFLNRF